MEGDPIRVLYVAARDESSASIERALAEAGPVVLEASRTRNLSESLEKLGEERFDALLVDLATDGGLGLEAVVRMRAHAGAVPIVVLAEPEQEALALKSMQVGAQDYLLKPNVHAMLLTRCLRHAVERFQAVDDLQRRAHEWEDFWIDEAAGPTADVVARVYGNAPLHEQLPEAFEELVRVYASILDDAVEEREYRVYHQIRDRIRRLADELGFLRAGPRDVVEVHTSAMRSRASEIGKRRLEAYLAEGRLIVVELMGLLVSFYRRYSLAARPVRVKERGTHIRQGGESNE